MTGRIARVLAVALGATVLAGGPAGAQQQGGLDITTVDAARYPTVTATVVAPPGIEGVNTAPDSLEVLESGVAVPFTVERVSTNALEVVLLVDASGSMRNEPIAEAKAAVDEFVGRMPSDVPVGVVAIGPNPTTVVSPTTDRTQITTAVEGLVADGKTALYDSIIHAGGEFTSDTKDRVIVLLSDGGDTISRSTVDQALASLDGIRLHVIELVTKDSNPMALLALARKGAGTISSVEDPAELTALYQQVASSIVNQYRVSYASSAYGEQTLAIRLTTPGGVLEDTAAVSLPADPAAVAPPATAAPATSVADVAAPPLAPIRLRPGADTGSTWLLAGAGAMFVALAIVCLVLFTSRGHERMAKTRLGMAAAAKSAPTPSQIRERMVGATDSMLEHRERGQELSSTLEVAGLAMRPGEFVLLTLLIAVATGMLLFALVGPLVALAALLLVPLAARAWVRSKAAARRQKFEEQLPDILQMLTGTLRSGYGLLQALDNVAQEALEPSGSEFRRVLMEVRVGRDLSTALQALATRMGSEDFEWVVSAIDINRDVGGDLATVLDNVSATIRDRHRLFRQMRALTAEGRVSAYILTGLPFALALAMAFLNPGYLGRLTTGPGLVMVGAGGALLLIGWIWMMRLCRIEY